jgi:hypothetical protein
MSYTTRITAVGLLLGALTSSLVQALPLNPPTRLAQRAEAGDLLTLAMDWLAPLFGSVHTPVADQGRARHGHPSSTFQEKEGTVLDPNGLH